MEKIIITEGSDDNEGYIRYENSLFGIAYQPLQKWVEFFNIVNPNDDSVPLNWENFDNLIELLKEFREKTLHLREVHETTDEKD